MTYDVSRLPGYAQIDEDMGVSPWPDPDEFQEVEVFEPSAGRPSVARRYSVKVSQNPFRQEMRGIDGK